MVGSFAGCCARAASGHAAAAPPSAASNSRRPTVTVIRPSRAKVREGNDTTSRACCPNSAARGADGEHAGHRLQRSAVRLEDSGLTFRDLFSAAPPHFLLDLRDDVDARSFLWVRRAPPNDGKPTSGARRLAGTTSQGGEATLLWCVHSQIAIVRRSLADVRGWRADAHDAHR